MANQFNIDINITKRCSMNCDYCFAMPEVGKRNDFMDLSMHQKTIEFIYKFLDHPKFKPYELLTLNFWGGEPTLRPDLVEVFVEKFEHDNRIRFFIFTNGYNIPDRLQDILLRLKAQRVGVHPKMCIQISYDGKPIHDIKRKSTTKRLTSDKVKKTILWCDQNKIPYVIKSTVTPDTFKYMYEAYSDIKKMSRELETPGFYKNVNYFPTIDYYTTEHLTQAEDKQYSYDLEQSLTKIAAEEIICVPRMHFFFKWFNPNRAKCSAGQHSVAVDIDGEIYVCHACLYGDGKSYHRLSNVESPKVFSDLFTSSGFHTHEYGEMMKSEGDCESCTVEFCLRCNHAKYNSSKKTKYLEKWTDFAAQPNLCKFYKINNNVKEAMFEASIRGITRRK